MFKILQKTIQTGLVTTAYPAAPAQIPGSFRGAPAFDFEQWPDALPAAEVCPTEAISIRDGLDSRTVIVDYGRCVFCGLCAGEGVRMTQEFELAARDRGSLVLTAEYELNPDGTQGALKTVRRGEADADTVGQTVRNQIHKLLGRSLSIREVDAGSCNGCELEIIALNNPIYDIERFGIHFVASPRHADMLLVTGPVTTNMREALRKTYAATPDPKWVIASGDCAIDGGCFAGSYACTGGVANSIPVDLRIKGCPPSPLRILEGLLALLAVSS